VCFFRSVRSSDCFAPARAQSNPAESTQKAHSFPREAPVGRAEYSMSSDCVAILRNLLKKDHTFPAGRPLDAAGYFKKLREQKSLTRSQWSTQPVTVKLSSAFWSVTSPAPQVCFTKTRQYRLCHLRVSKDTVIAAVPSASDVLEEKRRILSDEMTAAGKTLYVPAFKSMSVSFQRISLFVSCVSRFTE